MGRGRCPGPLPLLLRPPSGCLLSLDLLWAPPGRGVRKGCAGSCPPRWDWRRELAGHFRRFRALATGAGRFECARLVVARALVSLLVCLPGSHDALVSIYECHLVSACNME